MNKGNVWLGVLAGLAVGAVLGVLFAPASGAETRRKVAEKGNDLAESLKSKFDKLIDDLTGTTEAPAEEQVAGDKP
jgi:gas vesicle protein